MKLRALRIFGLLGVFIAVLCIFTLRLMRYQITDGASYRTQAQKATVESIDVEAPRGEILDRFGRVLATNTVNYSAVIEKTAFPTATENANLLKITAILTKNGSAWVDTLPVSSQAPYTFNAGSDSDVKTLRSFLKNIDKSISNKTKRAAALAQDDTASADVIMARLKTRYDVASSYTSAQQRTLIGLRYEMEKEGFSISGTFTIAKNISFDTVTQLKEQSVEIPGIEITQQYTRTYPDGTVAPQVIGSVGALSSKQYAAKKSAGYAMDDVMGQSGIESTMEKYLRGTNGKENIEINSQGQIIDTDSTTQSAKPGDNVVLTIDSDLQKVVQNSLPEVIAQVRAASGGSSLYGSTASSASAVVLNIKTGEVLAMASYPSYDLNTYNQNIKALTSDPNNPLLNRAITGRYRPGSTFKPCTATAGLMNGVITPTSTIACNGLYTTYSSLGYTGNDDGSYGNINVSYALGVSSNVFFNTVADRLGGTKLEATAKALGLGQKTGIELPGESSGVVSGPTEKKDNGGTWYPADAAQSGIGQLDNLYTPLQLANYVGAVVNGGTRYQVHIVKKVTTYDNSKTVLENEPKVISTLKIPGNFVTAIKEGMKNVVDNGEGTAHTVFANFNFPAGLGGKTGTAQIGKNSYYNGLFVGFAPYDDPEIVVAVVVEHGHNGYQTAPVARDVFNYYFVHDQQYTSTTLPDAASALPVKSSQLIP